MIARVRRYISEVHTDRLISRSFSVILGIKGIISYVFIRFHIFTKLGQKLTRLLHIGVLIPEESHDQWNPCSSLLTVCRDLLSYKLRTSKMTSNETLM